MFNSHALIAIYIAPPCLSVISLDSPKCLDIQNNANIVNDCKSKFVIVLT